MNSSTLRTAVFAVTAAATMLTASLASASAGSASTLPGASRAASYSPGTPQLDSVTGGPWTTSQGDSTEGTAYSPSLLLPTYTPGGATTTVGGVTEPNLAVYPGANAGSGAPPYASGVAGTPGPVPGYCSSGGPNPESGTVNREPRGEALPMSPYYFPDVVRNHNGTLTGYFDYRPKDTDEAIVAATSGNGGLSWKFRGQALEQNPGYCPSGDTNDNGQGHPFVLNVGRRTFLYTVNRPTGDSAGVGLLVHQLASSSANPLAGLPSTEPVGTDPDTRAAAGLAVPATGATGVNIPVSTLGSGPEQIGAPGSPLEFEDVAAKSPSGSVITCTGTSSYSLTGCTAAGGGLLVNDADTLLQALSTVTSAVTIPQGPQNAAGTVGASVSITSPSASIASLFSANVPGRFYIDGATVYCVDVNGSSTQLSSCTTTQPGGVSVSAGDVLTTDPIVPATANQTSGLVAPDGIVGALPGYSAPGVPNRATVIVYGEKILNYYAPTISTNTSALTLSSSTPVTIPVVSTDYPVYQAGSSGVSLQIGTGTKSSPGPVADVTCTGETGTSFTGCTSSNASGDAIPAGADVGGPGACTEPDSTLSQIGEGGTNPASLFKNNEDYTSLRIAWTTNGVVFHNVYSISGNKPDANVNNPSATVGPLTAGGGPANAAPGSTEPDELRFVGSRGSIIRNSNGSYGMFLSGAWCADGDSDSFNQIFYTSSHGGRSWSAPVSVVSTDYTFAARAAQDAALASGQDEPLGVSGYYAGRAYSPAVVQNPNGTLTMVFSGYSTPKPLPTAGAVLGTGATTWTVGAGDPALYRNILTVTLSPSGRGWR